MKKILTAILSTVILGVSAFGFSACTDPVSTDAVNLVNVSAAEVGVRSDIDYFVIPEPAASTKVGAISTLNFAGDLQSLYGGENGYPQAVVVAKNQIISYVAEAVSVKLKAGAEWLLDEATSPESIINAVSSHLSQGMSPTFNAKNLSKQVIKNCSVNFVDAHDCREEVNAFMQKFNAVSETPFGTPSGSFFYEPVDYGATQYEGKISVYAPDGAPALGLAKLMSTNEGLNCSEIEYNVVDATTIQTFVTGATPKADICVLPVNLAVKLLGGGEKYKMLGTLTHGNLFIVSNGGDKITKENLSSLRGKTVGVVNLPQVPGLTLKTILKDNGIEFEELK
ncbi:MAG: hypothetical protein K2K38_03980 [Clostridia bacterium]|nr:hypothetical protein [Clostridia bacterium]